MKFCYLDVGEKTDINDLFEYYGLTNESLKYNPNTIFIPITVPLKTNSDGWKIKIKRLIGYQDWTDPDNIWRNEFNNLIKVHFKGEPIFSRIKQNNNY